MGGGQQDWIQLRERVTGKWQLPLLVVSLFAFGLSLLTYQSPTDKIPFYELRDGLPDMIDRGLYTVAIETGSVLLQIPDKTERELAPVHRAMGTARVLRAERNEIRVPSVGEFALEHFTRASAGGVLLTPDETVLLGRAYEWSGDLDSAVASYELALVGLADADLNLRWLLAQLHLAQIQIGGLARIMTSVQGVSDLICGVCRKGRRND